MKVTELGRELRKLRIDAGTTLGDMATALGMSSAYLSAIELGKRPCPRNFVESVGRFFSLNPSSTAKLYTLADQNQTEFRIAAAQSRPEAREVAGAFARKFETLTTEQLEQLRTLLGEK